MEQRVNFTDNLSASVPAEMEPLFRQAQGLVEAYFSASIRDVSNGIFKLGGNRHLIMRGDALGSEFFRLIRSIYGEENQTNDIANALLFDLSHAIGAADAKKFIDIMGLKDPIEKLAVGPIYFAHAGFARVVIQPESNPTPNDDFVLYYRHENSFEAESWLNSGEKVEAPVCILSTGYSSGWCSTAFGLPLIAVEYACVANGDEGCDFVMAPPHRISEYLDRLPSMKHSLYVPKFFGRREHEESMKTLAYRDSLTGLSNRTFFSEMGQKLLDVARRHDTQAGLLFLDLDDFKSINDSYGHTTGDFVLKVIADRISDRLRSSDLVARWGGDEFVILLQEPEGHDSAESLAEELIEIISQPVGCQGRACSVGASIGGVLFHTGAGYILDTLISDADAAMYEAKSSGKNGCKIRSI
jgi:diguanylate cyclase (GGDEF)-like protein